MILKTQRIRSTPRSVSRSNSRAIIVGEIIQHATMSAPASVVWLDMRQTHAPMRQDDPKPSELIARGMKAFSNSKIILGRCTIDAPALVLRTLTAARAPKAALWRADHMPRPLPLPCAPRCRLSGETLALLLARLGQRRHQRALCDLCHTSRLRCRLLTACSVCCRRHRPLRAHALPHTTLRAHPRRPISCPLSRRCRLRCPPRTTSP